MSKIEITCRFVLIILVIVSTIIFLDYYSKDREFDKILEEQTKVYNELQEKGYCINGTEYLYSEKYNRGIEVIKFEKCEDIR